MKLRYIGPDPATRTGALPLPEGWPAADHDEPDEAAAREKVASGNYTRRSPVEIAARGRANTGTVGGGDGDTAA